MSTLDPGRTAAGDRARRTARLSAAKRAVLAQRLAAPPDTPRTTVPRQPPGAAPVLSPAQERLWFMEQFAPGTAAYTVPVVARLRGRLDPDLVRRALAGCVARHDSLRATFSATEDGDPTVAIAGPRPVDLSIMDISIGTGDGDPAVGDAGDEDAGNGDAGAQERVRALIADALSRPFDLAAGPLLRASLFRLGADDHVLLLAIHHIVCDGWSASILVAELVERIDAAAGHRPPDLPDLPVSYQDYAAWQRERGGAGGYADDLAYWLPHLARLPPLDLPTDRVRPDRQTFHGATHSFTIDRDLAGRLAELGRRYGATLYMTVLAAFQALLGRYARQDDFAVGSPVAGRGYTELEPVVGLFLNMLAMRADLAGDPSFAELLRRTRQTALDAYSHQDVPFEHLVGELDVARDVRRPPLFQVIFAMQDYGAVPGTRPAGAAETTAPARNGTAETTAPARNGTAEATAPAPAGAAGTGTRHEPFLFSHPATRYELELYVAPRADGDGDGLHGTLVYNSDLFTAATSARFADHLVHLLRAVVADPDRPVSTVDLLDPVERDLVLHRWNDTATPVPGPATLPDLVAAQAAATPGATAVRCDGRSYSYAEVDARANQVAHRLRAAGAGPDGVVAVHARRSVELVVALLGVVKAGAGYLPLDPDLPARRLAFMLADSGASIVLTQRELADDLTQRELAGAPIATLALDDPAVWRDQPRTGPPPSAGPDHLAYVIYTSGSTGTPKGVTITHRAIVNRLDWMGRAFPLGAGDAVLQKTPIGFDVSVWEFFWPLATGARLVLARPGGHKDAAYLRDLIVAESVTIAHFVPSMLAVFLAGGGAAGCRSLRRIVCSGEVLSPGLAADTVRALPGVELHNLYGPTEAAIDVSAWHCRPGTLDGRTPVPIGYPIQNIRLHVLDDHGNPVPIGVPGQVHIAGVGLARGYLNRPELTARKFPPDPYGPPGSRHYATGDLARRRADGALEFLGRLDTQVKIRGLRIELGEIESVLCALPAVAGAVVTAREDVPGDQRLVAYLVGRDGQAPEPAALRRALKESLPDYMVPSAFVTLDALPLTPNGKLDRAALPAPRAGRDLDTEFVAPRTPTEEAVAAIWREVLGTPRVGVRDDFFDLGGHSLLAVQVVARARRVVPDGGAPVTVMDLFTGPTVEQLAALLDTPADQRGPQRLLHELTRPVPPGHRVRTLVCVPYGGGSAVVYQPLADALPEGHTLYSVAVPGHDLGLAEQSRPLAEVAGGCVAEIQERIDGPLVLYGHCGLGSALVVEIARQLAAAGRALEAVYLGGVFPFARPTGRVLGRLAPLLRHDKLASYRHQANWLKSMGVDVDELGPQQARRIVANMRHDFQAAEAYFTRLIDAGVPRLDAPVISVVGSQDPSTDYARERYREWGFLSDRTALVVLDEGGHYFLKYRADELAEIVTGTHPALAAGPAATGSLGAAARGPDPGWWLDRHHGTPPPVPPATPPAPAAAHPAAQAAPTPSMARFLVVVLGQLVSITGSALTEFAIPIWIYLETGSLARFAIFFVVGLVPGMLVAPVAGATVDRFDRRRVMLCGDAAAASTQLAFGILLWTGHLQIWHIYLLLSVLSVALTFQRLAYTSAVPQLVPKRYLGHANGFVQTAFGTAQFVVPLVAVGLMAAIGLSGILAIDIGSYLVAIAVLLLVRFPATMAYRRREPFLAEIRGGLRYTLNHRGIRAMLLFFAVLNIFLGPLTLLATPLVLSFAGLSQVGQVSFGGAVGVVLGGLTMTVWGGPSRRRMHGMLLCVLVLAACCAITGLRPATASVMAGVFGTMFALTLVNANYATIVQVTVPQRFHGRVFALNTILAWSTLPLGFALIVPFGPRLFDPLMAPGGALAGTVGHLIGVGPGRGIGLMYLVFALAMAVLVVGCLRVGILSRFDDEVDPAPPDDLFGVQARQERRERQAREEERGHDGRPPREKRQRAGTGADVPEGRQVA